MPDLLFANEIRQKRADAVENYALLLETAKRLFDEQGVEHVSMSAIAEAAGVGKGTLYRHFPNKVALTQALLDADQRDLQARTFAYLAQPGDPVQHLRWFMGEAFAFVSRNLTHMYSENPQVAWSLLDHPAHLWWRLTIRGLLARIHPGTDVDYAADVLYVMLDARTIAFQRNALGYDVDRMVSGLLATVDRFVSR
ncbi:MAG: helix-turn-helix domain-containing protein [Chloroflexota bacterium]|nr:helix-turn-helix domain-containing protein [Chloroflexota bacterium]